VVEIHWNELLPLVEDLRAALDPRPITLFVHDVLTQKLRSEARGSPSLRRRGVSALKALRAGQVEPRLLRQVDHVFAFSAKDAQLLRRMRAAGRVDVVDPPIRVSPEPAATQARPVVTFTGAMSRPVNAESVRWFIDTVWPHVHASVPEAVFVVAGAAPPAWLLARESESLNVTGFVEDLHQTYRNSSLFVAPLRVGAGLKFKVLDAMAHGLPVVATPVAAEGIVEEAEPGCFAAITDDPREMAASIVATLRDPAGARRVGERARRWVQDRFDFDRSVQRALEVYAELAVGDGHRHARPGNHEP
jgi:glycosyltransferase involved in cell wall biosynthesis